MEIKPLVRYSGRIIKIEGDIAVASLKEEKDLKGLERDISLGLKGIESKEPIQVGNVVKVELYVPNGSPISGIKVGRYVEKAYIVNQ